MKEKDDKDERLEAEAQEAREEVGSALDACVDRT